MKNQELTSTTDYLNEYENLLEICERHITEFKEDMNNLVMQDVKLTDMNNELVELSTILITEINNKINMGIIFILSNPSVVRLGK